MRVAPKSRQAWRDWLRDNHDKKTEVWLVFYKRHTGKPTLSYDDAVEEALCFGWIDGIKRGLDEQRYMHRFSPRKPSSRWSASNRERAARMMKAEQMTAAGLKAIEDAKRSGKWDEAPAPSIDFSMPPELARRLRGNKKAAAFFESLAPSYQRQFIAWINVAKRPQTRQRRVAESIALLARGEKLGMR